METRFSRLRRLEQEQRDFSRAMYGHAPCNVEWFAHRFDNERRQATAAWQRQVENRLLYVESRLLALEERNRQHVADTPRPPKAAETPQPADTPPAVEQPSEKRSIPISIQWRKRCG